jgi:hypothetical protein
MEGTIMPQRAISLTLTLIGLAAVLGLLLLRLNPERAAQTGPRWKRRLVALGLVLLTGIGFAGCEKKSTSSGESVPVNHAPVRNAASVTPAVPGNTAPAIVADLAKTAQWQQVSAAWREAADIGAGKRGDYPFNLAGKKKLLAKLEQARKNIAQLQAIKLLSEPEAGLLAADLTELTAQVNSKRPEEERYTTCYDMMMVIPARVSMERLAQRLPLLTKMSAQDAISPEVVAKVVGGIEKDIAVLDNPENLARLSAEERVQAQELGAQAAAQVIGLKHGALPKIMCYEMRELPSEKPNVDKLSVRRSLIEQMAQANKISAAVEQKASHKIAEDLDNFSKGA